MLKSYKKALTVSSAITLLPIPVGLLLWNRFPAQMAVHWGITGQPDGWAGPALSVIAMPLVMLALHLLCFFLTLRDPGNKERNRKPLTMVLWIVPVVCNLSCFGIYALALGVEVSVAVWTAVPMGLLFAVIGNYMPKMKMNSTMGIKVPWTYTSEKNWNATHRFAGKVWMVGGIAVMFCGFLPERLMVTVMLLALLVMTVIPVVYAYRFYKREKAEGTAEKAGYSPVDKKILKGSMIFLAVLLVFVVLLLFTGDLQYSFEEHAMTIRADWYTDLSVRYDTIDDIEYREGNIPGSRVGGFGSFRLLMGFFKNEEFGTYTRYTYYDPQACVVLTAGSRTFVLSGKDAAGTQAIYETLLQKIS